MVKHYCDGCGFEIPTGTMVRIAMRVRNGGKNLDENFPTCVNEIVKDYCTECGKKVIGEDTIKSIVEDRLKRLKLAEERRKEREKKNEPAEE